MFYLKTKIKLPFLIASLFITVASAVIADVTGRPSDFNLTLYADADSCLTAAQNAINADEPDAEMALSLAERGLDLTADSAKVADLNCVIAKVYEYRAYQLELKALFTEASERYDSAVDLYTQAGAWDKVARVNLKLANCHVNLYDNDAAKRFVSQALAIAREHGSDEALFNVLYQQKKIARQTNDYSLYLSASESMDSLFRETDSPEVKADAYRDLAETAKSAGNYVRASEVYRSLLTYFESRPDDPDSEDGIQETLDQLADIAQETGNYDEVIALASRNLELKKLTASPVHLGEALCYNRLSTAWISKGDSIRASLYADSIVGLLDHDIHPFYRAYMAMLGGIAMSGVGRPDDALECLDSAMDMSALHASIYPLKAGQLRKLKRYHEARQCMERYYEITCQRHGDKSLQAVSALTKLANLKVFDGDADSGAQDYMQALVLLKDLLHQRLKLLPSSLRQSYISQLSESLSLMTPFAIKSGRVADEFSKSAYEGLLLTKGLLLASEQSTAELLNRHGSADDLADYAELQRTGSRITQLERTNAQQCDTIARLYARYNTLDNRLAQSCSRYGDVGAFLNTTYSDIASALRPGETLVDITDYLFAANDRRYAAFVIRRDLPHPIIVPLCKGADLDTLLARSDGQLSRLHEGETARMLRHICIDPVSEYITPGQAVMVVPSGFFHSIAIGSLPLTDSTWVSDRNHIVRLSSARELLIRERRNEKKYNMTASLYGGIIYDMDQDEMVMASHAFGQDLASAFATRQPSDGAQPLNYLPYTLKEVEDVAGVLSHADMPVVSNTGKNATESSFLSMSGHSPAVIHVATHGFYFDSSDPDIARGLAGHTDPMNLSGLVMSGGNAEWTGQPLPPFTLGGLLTAADIARCDLSQTRLVCLSACNSAKGNVTSEGLYGLQRAFKKAGAQTLVMSLWEASERSTALFMTEFYTALMGNGFRRHEAFRIARDKVRQVYPEPYYWAGFILVD